MVAKKRSAQIVHRTCDVAGLTEKVVEFTRECQEYRRKKAVAQAAHKPDAAPRFSRRRFIAGLSLSITALVLLSRALAGILRSPGFSLFQHLGESHPMDAASDLLYPPVDLSYFEIPIGHRI